jgi:DNA modification methylase
VNWLNQCHFGDCIETMRRMPDGIVQTCVTSPPYFGLRDYGHEGQIGLEPTPAEFVAKLVEVFREVRRVLRDDGTLWLNLGDSYAANRSYQVPSTLMNGDTTNQAQAGSGRGMLASDFGLKPKDLIGIPWRVALALQADGWYLRQDIIWHKPNPMPESVTDRCTKAHEYIFLLSKSERYTYDREAVQEQAIGGTPGNTKPTKGGREYEDGASEHRTAANLHNIGARETRNKRSVWTVATTPYKGAHFATFPTELIEPCILAGAPVGAVVLDPFFGSGTTGQVAQTLGRAFIGCELNPDYKALQDERLRQTGFQFLEAEIA